MFYQILRIHKCALYAKVVAHIVCSFLAMKKGEEGRGAVGGSPKADLALAENIALALYKGSSVLEGQKHVSPSYKVHSSFFNLFIGNIKLWFTFQCEVVLSYYWSHQRHQQQLTLVQ